MRSFSNIMPNFAGYLHLLVDSIGKELPDYFTHGARKSFYRQQGRRQKVFEKIQGIRYLVLAECGLH